MPKHSLTLILGCIGLVVSGIYQHRAQDCRLIPKALQFKANKYFTLLKGATELSDMLTCASIIKEGYVTSLEEPTATADPKDYLRLNGVLVEETDSDHSIQQAACILQDDSTKFWVKHAAFHPNQKRVKNWLWVHERYRDKADSLLAAESETVSKQQAVFQKLHKKIQKHSEFEDQQLFKFFADAGIGNQSNLKVLTEQHNSTHLVDEINEEFDKVLKKSDGSSRRMLQQKLEQYVKDMKEHLDLEEATIVSPWLQLTEEQYKAYRSHLSWFYSFMY